MLLSSPLFGGATPLFVRLGMSSVLSLALIPILQPYIGPAPVELYLLAAAVVHEVLSGLLIGTMLQILLLAAQMAGSFLDLQVGLGAAHLFNPMLNAPTTLLSQFKFMLALVLLLLTNGHHLMFQAFVQTYGNGAGLGVASLPGVRMELVSFIGQMCMLSLQIAAPVAAVSVVVDAATGIVNKAVPQMQAYVVALPAKIIMGILALALGLPLMVTAVQSGVEHTFTSVYRMFGRG